MGSVNVMGLTQIGHVFMFDFKMDQNDDRVLCYCFWFIVFDAFEGSVNKEM